MKLTSKAVHAGDRKRTGSWVPVTTPIHTATSYSYDDINDLDRVFGKELQGQSYARYSNPTNDALEELEASGVHRVVAIPMAPQFSTLSVQKYIDAAQSVVPPALQLDAVRSFHAHPLLAPILLPLAALIATSRVTLRVHHASDVVAGVLLGLAGAAGAALLILH